MLDSLAGLVSGYDGNHELDSVAVGHISRRRQLSYDTHHHGSLRRRHGPRRLLHIRRSRLELARAPTARRHGPMRQCVACHLSLHSSRLRAALLHLPWHGQVPLLSEPTSLRHACSLAHLHRRVNRRSHQFKWVGLFAIALVGLCSMEDLWEKFGGFRMRVRNMQNTDVPEHSLSS